MKERDNIDVWEGTSKVPLFRMLLEMDHSLDEQFKIISPSLIVGENKLMTRFSGVTTISIQCQKRNATMDILASMPLML